MKEITKNGEYSLIEQEEQFEVIYNGKFLIGWFKPFTDKKAAVENFNYIVS